MSNRDAKYGAIASAVHGQGWWNRRRKAEWVAEFGEGNTTIAVEIPGLPRPAGRKVSSDQWRNRTPRSPGWSIRRIRIVARHRGRNATEIIIADFNATKNARSRSNTGPSTMTIVVEQLRRLRLLVGHQNQRRRRGQIRRTR